MNNSMKIEFILLGLTDDPLLQIVIFLFLFVNYILSLMGNLIIILLTLPDPILLSVPKAETLSPGLVTAGDERTHEEPSRGQR